MKSRWIIIGLLSLCLVLGACSNAGENGQTNLGEEGWIDHEFVQSEMDDLQQEVNEGHRPGLTDPIQVAREFISDQDWEVDNEVERETIVDQGTTHMLQYTLMDGRVVQIELIQPSETGESGIYVVNRYRFSDQ